MAGWWQAAREALALWAGRVPRPQPCLPGRWLRRGAQERVKPEQEGGGRGLRGGGGGEGAALTPSPQS